MFKTIAILAATMTAASANVVDTCSCHDGTFVPAGTISADGSISKEDITTGETFACACPTKPAASANVVDTCSCHDGTFVPAGTISVDGSISKEDITTGETFACACPTKPAAPPATVDAGAAAAAAAAAGGNVNDPSGIIPAGTNGDPCELPTMSEADKQTCRDAKPVKAMDCSCHDGTNFADGTVDNPETFVCPCPTTDATKNIADADIAAECAAICDIKDADNKSICNSEKEKKVAACKPCADCHEAIDATKNDDTYDPSNIINGGANSDPCELATMTDDDKQKCRDARDNMQGANSDPCELATMTDDDKQKCRDARDNMQGSIDAGGNTGGNTDAGGNTGGNTGAMQGSIDAGGNTGGNTGANTGGNTGGNTGAMQGSIDAGGNTGGNTDAGGNTGGNTGAMQGSIDAGGNTGGNTGANTGGTNLRGNE